MAASVESAFSSDSIEETKTLIGALNLLSRNLPLPADVFDAVSSIYHDGGDARRHAKAAAAAAEEEEEEPEEDEGGDGAAPSEEDSNYGVSTCSILVGELEDALLKQQLSRKSCSALEKSKDSRYSGLIHHRLMELEALPPSLGEDLQMNCLLELYGLKLLELQGKVRSYVSAEYWLHEKCAYPDKQLFDWGMMRLRYPCNMYGIGDAFMMEADDQQRKKKGCRVLLMEEIVKIRRG